MKLDFKPDIPFTQKVDIEGNEFEFEFWWRKSDDTILLNLYNSNSELLVSNEEIRYGMPLFSRMIGKGIRQDLPQKLIVPISETGKYERVGIDNIFIKVHLILKEIDYLEEIGR